MDSLALPKLCGAHVIALWSWELTRLDAHRKTCTRPRRCGGGNHAFPLKDDADHKISGYTTFDLMGSQETGFGTFSAGKEYSTVWGQRAAHVLLATIRTGIPVRLSGPRSDLQPDVVDGVLTHCVARQRRQISCHRLRGMRRWVNY